MPDVGYVVLEENCIHIDNSPNVPMDPTFSLLGASKFYLECQGREVDGEQWCIVD